MPNEKNQQKYVLMSDYFKTHTYVPSEEAKEEYQRITDVVSNIGYKNIVTKYNETEFFDKSSFFTNTITPKHGLSADDTTAISACITQDFITNNGQLIDYKNAKKSLTKEYNNLVLDREIADVILTMKEAYSDPSFCSKLAGDLIITESPKANNFTPDSVNIQSYLPKDEIKR
jgi:hypothetical protein